RGVPLWSIGTSMHLPKFGFFDADWVSRLTARLTYGVNGNVNNTISVYPTANYVSSPHLVTQTGYAQLRSAGNPGLRWEKVNVLNAGLDYGLFNNRLSGSVEYYIKRGNDLIGENFMD